MTSGNHWKAWLFTAAIVSSSCGGRSALLAEQESASAGSGGQPGEGQGGATPRGGNAASAGTFGQAGTFQSAGSFGDTGSASGGAISDCPLAVADCATPAEPVCDGVRRACSGDFQTHIALDAVGDVVAGVAVSELSVSVDGRVAIAGFFHGEMNVGGHVLTSPIRANSAAPSASFVASFNNHGDVEWATAYPGQTNQEVTGLDFAPNGDIVMQAFTGANDDEPRAATVRFDATGKVLWNKDWGKLGHVGASRVGIDNDGRTWLGGSMTGSLGFPGSNLSSERELSAYVLSLDPQGNPLKAFTAMPKGMIWSEATGMAVDDEDSIILVGNARSESKGSFAFLEKLSSDGSIAYSKLFAGNMRITGVAVDRLMRPILVAEFSERFTNEGTTFPSNGTRQVWLAQYTREGSLAWQRAYEGNFSEGGIKAGVVTADPFGNVVVSGTGALDLVGGKQLASHHMNDLGNPDITWLMKLRPDATPVWTRQIDGAAHISAISTDNSGYIWLGGQFLHKIWLGNRPVTGSSLLAQMSP
jgi:hypothetical protein